MDPPSDPLVQSRQTPFRAAAAAPSLTAAYDELVGPGAWQPMFGLGTFPVRFPSSDAPDDDGRHIDTSFGRETQTDFLKWWVNVASRGRALLALFLLSDVSEDDAPTRIRVGSHTTMARVLVRYGDEGATLGELAADGLAESVYHRMAVAIGRAGTVYLCHRFLVHAAQQHRGAVPKFMASRGSSRQIRRPTAQAAL